MKKELIKFQCDNCKKESCIAEGEKGFPYEHEWVYLFKYNFKQQNQEFKEERDKHFCGDDCMVQFIDVQTKKRRFELEETKKNG